MKNKLITILIIISLGFIWACEDLDVEDLNDVKLEDVFSDPDLFPSFVEGVAFDFWKATEWSWPSFALACASQTIVSSYTNYGSQDMNLIPRAPFNNSTTYNFRSINVIPWQYLNAGIVKVNQIFQIVNNEKYDGIVIDSEGKDITNRIIANGYFLRGLCLGNLGLVYDKAFIVRPETEEIVFSTWDVVIDSAIVDLERAISIVENDNTVLNEGFNGVVLNAAQIAQLASTYIAKLEAAQARNEDDVVNMVDWNRVKTYAEKGLTFDFEVIGDGFDNWWSRILQRGQRPTSARTSQRLIKMMNPNKPEVVYPWPDGVSSYPEITSPEDNRLTTDYRYYSSIPYPASRGYWYFSNYSYIRYEDYNIAWSTPIPVFSAEENDLLWAEALVRTGGSKADAANKINNTRVTRGGLTPLNGSETDDELLRAITYERLLEFSWQGFGNGFFYRRITTADDLKLEVGQFRHLPIPAYELEILGEDVYTFGGVGNEE